jgi:hypothetical protein
VHGCGPIFFPNLSYDWRVSEIIVFITISFENINTLPLKLYFCPYNFVFPTL